MKNLNAENAIEKVAKIKLIEDYGGVKAWSIQESFNGVIADPYSSKILKREHFRELQTVILVYLSKGFKVEIIK